MTSAQTWTVIGILGGMSLAMIILVLGIVNTHFKSVFRRLEEIDRRFADIDRRIEQMDQRFDALERDIQGIMSHLRGEGAAPAP